MDEYKASFFNEYLGCKSGKWILYNNLSGGLIEVDQTIYDALIQNKLESITKPAHLSALSYGKFIVDKNVNELDELKKTKSSFDNSVKVIGMQILPANGCNFRCVYCFEGEHSITKKMPARVMEEIISFVKKTIKPTTEFFNVSWFGSEPLLAIDRIEYLSNEFIDICHQNSIKYNASIVTNGYLLTPKNIDTLIRCGVIGCQVTLDGPAHIHDKRRMLKNGGKTWDTIVDNLKYAVDKSFSISVRINIDKTNLDHIESLFHDLKNVGIFESLGFSLGLVSKFGKACKSIEDNLLTIEKASEIIDQKRIREMLKGSRNAAFRPPPDFVGCVAAARHSLIIGTEGELYKCSKTIGMEEEVCGNISDIDWNHPNIKKWTSDDRYDQKKCQQCSMIPFCNGTACLFDMIFKRKNIYECDRDEFKKKHLKNIISFHHQRKELEKKGQKRKQ